MADEAIVFQQQSLNEKMLARLRRDKVTTEFVGYDRLEVEATIIAVIRDDSHAEKANAGEDVLVILDHTPFYAESGGQVGDSGAIAGPNGRASVLDAFNDHEFIVHRVHVEEGTLERKDKVSAEANAELRIETARNHTATHLLQWALRKVLGEHVHQAGSEVSPERLRFDFTHHTALSDEERGEVERLVNHRALSDATVQVQTLPIDEARRLGAIALFGEKYGDEVRMVSVEDFSKELCGGTHLDSTAQIGLFKIVAEESVAAGVRRVTALTGKKAVEHVNQQVAVLADICRALKTNPDTVRERIQNLQEQIKDLNRRLNKAQSADVRTKLDDIFSRAEDVAGVTLIAQEIAGADQKTLREACDLAKNKLKSVVCVLGSRSDGKVSLVAVVTPDLVKRGISAGKLIKEAAGKVGGGGGGRPEMAQAGGKDPDKLPDALASVASAVRAAIE
jgi:alanyl-tRNA synthetase